MISHKNKFAFIHISKCGGTSVTKTIANYYDINRSELRPKEYKFLTIPELQQILGKDFLQYFIFTVVRNPWDRLVSYYHHGKKETTKVQIFEKSFTEWIKRDQLPAPQTNQLYDQNKQFVSNLWIAQLEHIDTGWPFLCSRLNIDAPLQHNKKSTHRHYSYYYNYIAKDIVSEKYKEDIKEFNYKFGEK